jgi:BCD family chlorophyll transporter-like MFS transporter
MRSAPTGGQRAGRREDLALAWGRVGLRYLPFADAVTPELPLARLLRLALFQVSVGIAVVLLNGTLNRVMVVELGVPAALVALMVSLPVLFAPLRALVGFRSDTYRSFLGWRRVPFIWFGTLLQFGGLAIMPFALLVLSGDTHGPVWIGTAGAALAFLLVGVGLHTTQTAGLALASDLVPAARRPRVVALLYVMLLLGMVASAALLGWLLADFSQLRLIQVIQGAALVTMLLNLAALWKQEARRPNPAVPGERRPRLREAWARFTAGGRVTRFLVAVALGTAAFSMQDILLEPFGGQVLGLGVGATTALTAILASGSLAAFGLAAVQLGRGGDPHRLAALGVLAGILAFCAVIFAAPLGSPGLLRAGAALIGFGAGLFAVGTLTAAMAATGDDAAGLALGAWGAVQATAAGVGIALGGALRDGVSALATRGALGPGLADAAVGYSVVFHLEIALLFASLAALGPLVRRFEGARPRGVQPMGMAEFPG